MSRKQVFAYTEPTPVDGYAQYLQVFKSVGWSEIVIRDRSGAEHKITIPTADLIRLQNADLYATPQE